MCLEKKSKPLFLRLALGEKIGMVHFHSAFVGGFFRKTWRPGIPP
jgi:hypothetical protein